MPPPSDPPKLLSVDEILRLLPATFEGWPFCQPTRPPTARSVARIEAGLGIKIPDLLINVARANASYGYWFNSIGNDDRNPNHILRVNENYRRSGVPDRYVIFAQGFDGECDAWDLGEPASGGEHPIVSFLFGDDDELTHLTRRFDGFHPFMSALCHHSAPKCPVDELRRAALLLFFEIDQRPPG